MSYEYKIRALQDVTVDRRAGGIQKKRKNAACNRSGDCDIGHNDCVQ